MKQLTKFLYKLANEIADYDKAIKLIKEEVQKHRDLNEVKLHLHYKGLVLSKENIGLITDIFNRK